MDYRLSYTRDDTPYDADQEFLDAILRLNRESRLKVLVQIEKSSEFFYRTHRDFTFEEEYDGMIARIFQHECDHLEGILFVDRVSNLKKILLKNKLKDISIGKAKNAYKMLLPPVKRKRK